MEDRVSLFTALSWRELEVLQWELSVLSLSGQQLSAEFGLH